MRFKNLIGSKTTLLGLLIFFFLIASEWVMHLVSLKDWNYDLNGLLFFGQRLLSGDLHWTSTFDDKLPIVQFIFALPSAFESIGVWVLMSIVSVFGGAWACFIVVNDSLRADLSLTSSERSKYSLLASFSMIYLSTFMHGGIHHINPMAASAAISSIALLIIFFRRNQTNIVDYRYFVASAVLASIAIGIRPYFILMQLIASIWIIARSEKKNSLKNVIAYWFFWIALTGIFGIIVNFLPYLVTGQLEAFWAGMQMLSQTLHPSSLTTVVGTIFYNFKNQSIVETVLIIGSTSSWIYAVVAIFKKNFPPFIHKISLDIIVLTLLLPSLLGLMFVTKHFWPHYMQMLAPFFSIGFSFIFYIFVRNISINKRLIGTTIIATGVLASLPFLAESVNSILDKKTFKLDRKVTEISKFLDIQSKNQRDFLFLDDMYVHWKLKESRHGFPHSANTIHIFSGFWQSVKMPKLFSHPTNGSQYCMALNSKGPSILIVSDQMLKFEIECLSRLSTYDLAKKLSDGTTIYKRK